LTSIPCTFAHLTCILQPLPWEIQKVIFHSIIHTYFRLFIRYRRTKQTVSPLPTTPEKNVTALPCKMVNFFICFICNVAFRHAVPKFNPCRNKTLSQLVRIADWYSIHELLQYPNSAVPTSSLLSVEQKSTGSITEMFC